MTARSYQDQMSSAPRKSIGKQSKVGRARGPSSTVPAIPAVGRMCRHLPDHVAKMCMPMECTRCDLSCSRHIDLLPKQIPAAQLLLEKLQGTTLELLHQQALGIASVTHHNLLECEIIAYDVAGSLYLEERALAALVQFRDHVSRAANTFSAIEAILQQKVKCDTELIEELRSAVLNPDPSTADVTAVSSTSEHSD